LRQLEFKPVYGSKVYLRPFDRSDITPKYISWLNDPVVVRYSNQRHIQHTKESCASYLNSFGNSENMFLSIRDLSQDTEIGTMTAYISSKGTCVDIGIMIGDRSVWGSGKGKDAWCTLVKWFSDQPLITRVTAGTLSSNKAMIKLMISAGMVLENVRPSDDVIDGESQDIHYYGLSCDS
jgi:[ribosomal protein S5]-alanine N-acetyltransferase